LFAADANARGVVVRRGSYKKRDRQSGGHRAVSHFQIRDGGFGGWVAPLSSCPYLRAETLSSPLYLGTMALVLWIIPIRGLRAARRPIDSSGAAPRRPRTLSYTHGVGAKQLASAPSHRVSVESKKRSLTHPPDERPNKRGLGMERGHETENSPRRF
jgi:hypothetical protein